MGTHTKCRRAGTLISNSCNGIVGSFRPWHHCFLMFVSAICC